MQIVKRAYLGVKWTGWTEVCYLIFIDRRRRSRRPRNVSSVKGYDNFLSFLRDKPISKSKSHLWTNQLSFIIGIAVVGS